MQAYNSSGIHEECCRSYRRALKLKDNEQNKAAQSLRLPGACMRRRRFSGSGGGCCCCGGCACACAWASMSAAWKPLGNRLSAGRLRQEPCTPRRNILSHEVRDMVWEV